MARNKRRRVSSTAGQVAPGAAAADTTAHTPAAPTPLSAAAAKRAAKVERYKGLTDEEILSELQIILRFCII